MNRNILCSYNRCLLMPWNRWISPIHKIGDLNEREGKAQPLTPARIGCTHKKTAAIEQDTHHHAGSGSRNHCSLFLENISPICCCDQNNELCWASLGRRWTIKRTAQHTQSHSSVTRAETKENRLVPEWSRENSCLQHLETEQAKQSNKKAWETPELCKR